MSDICFIIDRSYNIKIICRTTPYIIFVKNTESLPYTNEVIERDLKKWQSGKYLISSYNENLLVIQEGDRIYDFTACTEISNIDMLWILFEIDDFRKPKSNKQIESKNTLELTKNSDSFTVIKVDYRIVKLDDNQTALNNLNDFIKDNYNYYVVGIRGYWMDNSFLNFNVTNLICLPSKTFQTFTKISLIMSKTSDEETYLDVHDMLNSITKMHLRLYYKESHILTVDLNNFISKSMSVFLEGNEESARKELTKAIKKSDIFTLRTVCYDTQIIIDFASLDIEKLNNMITLRSMDLVNGYGTWLSNTTFEITKLTFKMTESDDSKNPTDSKNPDDSDDFEKINITSTTIDDTPKKIKDIVKIYMSSLDKKNKNENDIIIKSMNVSNYNYNCDVLFKMT